MSFPGSLDFRVVVVGPGAVGLLFGGLLSRSGVNVCFLDKKAERAAILSRRGLNLDENGETNNLPVRATADPAEINSSDIILLCVKSYDVASGAAALSFLKKPPLIITLQNGIGHWEIIKELLPDAPLIAGVTFEGITLLRSGHIRRVGKAPTYLARHADPAQQERIDKLITMLNESGLAACSSENIEEIIWNKLLINVGINALSSLVGLKNGDLIRQPELLPLMEQAINEAAEVARRKGIKTDPNALNLAVKACEMTSDNRSSMLQDILNKKRTEIDAINGAIVREAVRLGVETPANRLLSNLVKVMEKTYRLRVLPGSLSDL